MSVSTAAIDRFLQNIDQRTETGTPTSEAHTDTPLFAWGVLGTPLVLPQPHFRLFIPSPYYVVGWGLLADQIGNAVVNVEHWTYVPGAAAVFSDVTGGAAPTLAMQQAVLTTRVTTWSPVRWGMFDLIHIYLASCDTIQELTFQLFTRRLRRVGVQGVVADTSGDTLVTSAGIPITVSHP